MRRTAIKPVMALVVMSVLGACASTLLPPEEAALVCEERARQAQRPSGSLTLGANSSGRSHAGISIGVTSDFLARRDPSAVYEDCVLQRSGLPPVRAPNL